MTSKIVSDISDFIFVSDTPKKVDAIFYPEVPILISQNMQPPFTVKVMHNG